MRKLWPYGSGASVARQGRPGREGAMPTSFWSTKGATLETIPQQPSPPGGILLSSSVLGSVSDAAIAAARLLRTGLGAMEVYNPPVKPLQALQCALVLLLLLPASLLGYPVIYQICSGVQLSCGGTRIDVVSPFRTDGQPESCGMQSFRLFCHGEYPAIQINSAIYWVRGIDYQTMMLTLVNMDFAGTPCPTEFANTDIRPFTLSKFDTQQVTIRYNCSCGSSGNYSWALPCPASASVSYAYLTAEPFTRHPYWGCICGATVSVFVGQSKFEGLAKKGNITNESFMEVLRLGFRVGWPDAYPGSGWCDVCKESGGNCTYDMLHLHQSCSCQDGLYSPMCPHPGATRWTPSKKFIIGATLGIGGFFVVSCLLFCFCRHFCHCKMFCSSQVIETRKKLKQTKYIDAFLKIYGSMAPKRYNYSELAKMTDSFSNTIGKGGFATVFKAKLVDGRSVAVKVLDDNSKCNGKVFVNEVLSIGWTYHVNIVSLLGYCLEGPVKALIYEFMPNGSLERFIFGDKRGTLRWEKLYDIAVGIAQGLEYLHRGCQMSILHFDIKPHNILLDHEFCPKISDFGLAKLCRMEKNDVLTSGAGGTIGYIAPEVINPSYGKASSKSDVYSYGMMILEMVGGRKNFEPQVVHTSEIYFPHWIYKHLDLDGNFQVCGALTEDEAVIARRMIMVGLSCIQVNPAERPSINRVVAMLEGRIEDIHMPSMPALYDPLGDICRSPTSLPCSS